MSENLQELFFCWITVGSVWADVFSPISKCLKLFTERAVILGKHKLFSKWSGQKDVLLLFFPSLSSITTLFMSFYTLSIHNYLNAFLNASFLGRVRHSHFGLLFNYSFFKDTFFVQLSSLWIKTESEHNAFVIIKLNVYVYTFERKVAKCYFSLTFDLLNFNFYTANACKPILKTFP